MNAKRKQSAVKKYTELLTENEMTNEEILTAIQDDEKAYPADEVQEIFEAVIGSTIPISGSIKWEKSPIKMAKQNPVDSFGSKKHYQEWDVKISTGNYDKLKIVRPVVKITEDQAETLNEGVLHGGNTYAKMYFLPE